MKVRYERGALADLEEIFAYIEAENPPAAARLVVRIEAAVGRISENPYIGQRTRNPLFRRLPLGEYLIVYEVGATEVVIHYVRHGARRRPWEQES
jgi:addiction module RelE/StbE family toxin